jgi:(p)ppGpp synthase/HD superfamily hydrolase
MGSNPIRVTLPDGTTLELNAHATAYDVAAEIGPGLAKAALAAEVDGELVDLHRPLGRDVVLRLITERDREALGCCGTRPRTCWRLRCATASARGRDRIRTRDRRRVLLRLRGGRALHPGGSRAVRGRITEVIEADYAFERQQVTKEEAPSSSRTIP